MNALRLELSLDLLREVNAARRREEHDAARLAALLLEQHDADARARTDVRQTSIFAVLTKRQA